MSNEELEALLVPDGKGWVHTRTEVSGSPEYRSAIYDGEDARFVVEMYGEDAEPKISFSGASACYNNVVSGIEQ